MSIFKCKMCGGTLEINANETVATCEYCGTQQTLPRLDNDKKTNLYDRANHFRRNNEYDKAMGIYEQILNEDKTDAEAYWSLVLCRYGIEYVEDPATHRRVPTVNRAQYTSIFDDNNYKSAIQYADLLQKVVYEEEAKVINEIQKGILAISQNEEPFDVFICYKETDHNGRRTPDSVLANDLYHQLVQEGFKVFFARITLEDKLGSAYEPYIFAALNSAKVMVVLGTKSDYFNAVWVKNEWSRYLSLIKNGANKMLIPAYKDMDPYDMPDEFSHLQAQDMSKLGFMQDLIRGIKKILAVEEKTVVEKAAIVSEGNNSNVEALLMRAKMFLEDSEWEKANEYCERILDNNPQCAEAYLIKVFARYNVKDIDSLFYKIYIRRFFSIKLDKDLDYIKVFQFGDEELKNSINRSENIKRNERNEEIYVRSKKDMGQANTANKYIEIAREFQDISEYKDAEELAKKCLEIADELTKKEKEEKTKCEQLIAELKASVKFEKRDVEQEIIDLTIKYQNISQIESIWTTLEEEKKAVNKQIETIHFEKYKLEGEKNNLNIFAIHRRQQIEKLLDSYEKERISLQNKLEKIVNRQGNYVSYNDVNTAVEAIRNELENLKNEKDSTRTYESIKLELSNYEFGRQYLRLLTIFTNLKKGSVVEFGAFNAETGSRDDKRKIKWFVIDVKDNKKLLISTKAIDYQRYHNSNDPNIEWETCSLRRYLNSDFLNAAFNENEKSLISRSEVLKDKVFLLSEDEVYKYLTEDKIKCDRGYGTPYESLRYWLTRCKRQINMETGRSIFEHPPYMKRYIRPSIWIDLN